MTQHPIPTTASRQLTRADLEIIMGGTGSGGARAGTGKITLNPFGITREIDP